MKNNYIIFLALVFVYQTLFAQQKQAYSPHPSHMVRNRGLISTIDSTRLRVWYALNADSIADMNTYIDYQRLDVGDSVSKYYSWFVYNSDSLLRDWHKKHPRARSIPKWLGPGGKKKDTWIQYEFSELYMQNGMLTEYACMPMWLEEHNSQYSEPIPRQSWIISFEMQELLGYTCQKATCHFRGRDYIAWFAPDIPVCQGPWKLGGLPGLILKAHDADSLYIFNAVKIETSRHPIIRYEYKNYKVETREKVQKMQCGFTENWWKAANYHKAEILPNGEIEMKELVSIFTPYEPLELE
ncbi:MAG: GLPGLI family protein [Bacteroidaceae bacterium]|nr:GLPGLI family protein [Bacteroidaceae bacterium]